MSNSWSYTALRVLPSAFVAWHAFRWLSGIHPLLAGGVWGVAVTNSWMLWALRYRREQLCVVCLSSAGVRYLRWMCHMAGEQMPSEEQVRQRNSSLLLHSEQDFARANYMAKSCVQGHDATIEAMLQRIQSQLTLRQHQTLKNRPKSGFEPMVFDRPLQHPTLPLDGNPWRVLVQGSLRIPVIRSGSRRLGPRPGEVFRKHRLRLAAYAELLEATQHVQTPFGLVFPADSHLGLAVPLPASERVNLSQRFERAVRWLRDSQSAHSEPRLPEDRNRCSGCELGYPRPIARKEIEEARRAHRPLLVLENADQKTYHCHCGDRFGGLPPHRKTLEMRLRATPD